MNISKVGRIYHVVDKTTGEVVKVGSTIRSIRTRQRSEDYRKRYPGCFLLEVRIIESSDLDWYDPKNSHSPFLWHLVAAEHIEMLKMDTYRKSRLSNRFSPLDQKARGFDATEFASSAGQIGGPIGGRKNVESGHIFRLQKKFLGIGSKAGGLKSLENKTGIWKPDFDRSEPGRIGTRVQMENKIGLFSPGYLQLGIGGRIGGKIGGKIGGRKNVESGHLSRLRTPEHQSRAAQIGNHKRYHVSKGVFSESCKICQEGIVNGSIKLHGDSPGHR